jgi:lipopolysaccharide assembly protein A
MKALFWGIATPLVIIAASFAVSNRHTVEVGIWPLPFIWDAPVYVIALGALGIGIALGGMVTGLGAMGAQLRARKASRRVTSLERELSVTAARDKPTLNAPTDSPAKNSTGASKGELVSPQS